MAVPAMAQTAPPEDQRLVMYRQLLTRANDELTQAAAQANTLSVENANLKTEIAKLKQSVKPNEPKADSK